MRTIARLLSNGSYSDVIAYLQLPGNLVHPTGQTRQFTVVGPRAANNDPSVVVACTLPDVPAAQRRFQEIFGRYALIGVPSLSAVPSARVASEFTAKTREPTRLPQSQGAPGVSPMVVCGLDCGCPPEALQCDPGGGEWEGPPPTNPPAPSFSVTGADASGSIICSGNIDNVHFSSTQGYYGNLNVHSWTTCPIPLNQSVSVQLSRQKCFWFYCWWSDQGTPGIDSRVSPYVEPNAYSGCQTGFWKSEGFHRVTFPDGYVGHGTSLSIARVDC